MIDFICQLLSNKFIFLIKFLFLSEERNQDKNSAPSDVGYKVGTMFYVCQIPTDHLPPC